MKSRYLCSIGQPKTKAIEHCQSSNLIGPVLQLDLVLVHTFLNALKGLHEVAEDSDLPLLAFLLRKTGCVEQTHLLEHRRLATLASS